MTHTRRWPLQHFAAHATSVLAVCLYTNVAGFVTSQIIELKRLVSKILISLVRNFLFPFSDF